MRKFWSIPAALIAVVSAVLLTAGCRTTSHSDKTGKSKKHPAARKGSRPGSRTPSSPRARASQINLSIDDVESLLKRAEPPKGGKVVALVYAGGIKGEIEPCG